MMESVLDARDHAAVVDRIIRTGQVVLDLDDVPGDFVAWRSALRRAARARASRLTLLRPAGGHRVFVLDPDYVVTEIEEKAMLGSLARMMRGEPALPRDVAVEQERRRQISAVPGTRRDGPKTVT